jgi:hypothetical protein
MPTTLSPRAVSGKKNVPVKWQNRAWIPRIVIRSSSRQVSWQTGTSDLLRSECAGLRRFDGAGRLLPSSGRRKPPAAMIPLGQRRRLYNISGSDNSL